MSGHAFIAWVFLVQAKNIIVVAIHIIIIINEDKRETLEVRFPPRNARESPRRIIITVPMQYFVH